MARRLATIPGKTSKMRSISSSVVYRLKLNRTLPWMAVNGTRIAVKTCEGSSEPEVHAEPLDDAAAKTQKGLRIFVRDDKPLESIAKRLEGHQAAAGGGNKLQPARASSGPPAGDGEVTLIMMLDLQTEVEMKLPGRFKVSPQIAGALKAVSGVVDVQTI